MRSDDVELGGPGAGCFVRVPFEVADCAECAKALYVIVADIAVLDVETGELGDVIAAAFKVRTIIRALSVDFGQRLNHPVQPFVQNGHPCLGAETYE